MLLTPHLGSFEVIAQAYAERFGARQPMTVLYRPARKAWLRELEETARARPGLATAPATLAGVRQMIRALRRGETVGLLPDQVPPEGMGVWAPFFGQPAYTMTLAARLVLQTGARAVAGVGERLPHGAGWCMPCVRDARAAARARCRRRRGASDSCAAAINRAMEFLIRQCPAQYLWGYNRYKRRGALARHDAVARLRRWPFAVAAALAAAARCWRRWAARMGCAAARAGRRRRRIATRNIELCLPELDAARAGARWCASTSSGWAAACVERGLLWYAPRERIQRLIQVEGDVHLAERTERR